MKSPYLFVYGSLLMNQKNEMAQFLQDHSNFMGTGSFQGKLFKISWFPGAVLSDLESDQVYGQVFQLKNESKVFAVLDDYEGIGDAFEKPHLFKKALINVKLNNAKTLDCWVYLYNHPVDHHHQIASGNYLEFINKNN